MADASSTELEDTTSTEEWVKAVSTHMQFLNQTWSTCTGIFKTAHFDLFSYLVEVLRLSKKEGSYQTLLK